jgi:hypothetical protein
MGQDGRGRLMALRFWGPVSTVGIALAVFSYVLDQLHKWYMLGPYGIAEKQPVNVAPGFDLVMVWNYGISYGWFASHSQFVRWTLIILSLVVSVVLVMWLAGQVRPLLAAAIGLVLGRCSRQRHRPAGTWRRGRLLSSLCRLVQLVRLQHRRRGHRCRCGRPDV